MEFSTLTTEFLVDQFNESTSNSSLYYEDWDYSPSHSYTLPAIAVRVTFITITAVLSIFSNLLCLLVLPTTTNSIPENNRILMMSLSAADLGVGFVTSLSIAPAIIGYWPYGNVICALSSALMNVFSGISIFTLVLISLDRYCAVTQALRYPSLVTRKKTITITISLWVFEMISCLVVFPLIGAPPDFNVSVAKCTPLWRPGKDTPVLLIALTCTIIIPFILMIFIYARLFLITRKQIKWIRQMNNLGRSLGNKSQAMSTHSDRKASRTFFTITIVFGIAWLPYTATSFYQNLSGDVIHDTAQFIATWASVSSSWWDVMTFAGMNSSFRRAAKRLLARGFSRCLPESNRVVPININMSEHSRETVTMRNTVETR